MVKALRFDGCFASGILVKPTQSLGFIRLVWISPGEGFPLRFGCVSHVHVISSIIPQELNFLWYLFVNTLQEVQRFMEMKAH